MDVSLVAVLLFAAPCSLLRDEKITAPTEIENEKLF